MASWVCDGLYSLKWLRTFTHFSKFFFFFFLVGKIYLSCNNYMFRNFILVLWRYNLPSTACCGQIRWLYRWLELQVLLAEDWCKGCMRVKHISDVFVILHLYSNLGALTLVDCVFWSIPFFICPQWLIVWWSFLLAVMNVHPL